MLRRLLLGLLKGTLLGGALGLVLVFGFGVSSLTGVPAYGAAILAGVCAALVAGKPIWASGAWVEVLLKSIAAAAVSVVLLWVMRTYLPVSASLGPLGSGPLSGLPLFVLPGLASLLAILFELDNNGDVPASVAPRPNQRVRATDASTENRPAADDYADDVMRAADSEPPDVGRAGS
jgi:hypothetical protein